ncbi:MAG: FKBP-type peptidyl-prolyl cis-trans isomerase [Bacteroidales bacterium]|nr:FKBP-type peptidyl-prolyl cis-trans isomerase [Bacteroidales bacterium]
MKKFYLFGVLAAGLALAACSPKAEAVAEEVEGEAVEAVEEVVKTAKDFTPSKKQIDSVSYLVGVNFGSFIKGYDFGDLNYSQIKKGMNDFIKAKGNMRDEDFGKQFKVDPQEMNRLFGEFLENRRSLKLLVNKEAEEKFLEKNKAKDGVVTLESGLQYRIIKEGGVKPTSPKDTVWVRYQGKTLDGNVFDEVTPDRDSVSFTLNHVIAGWTEGIQQVGEGGTIELFVPARLGYGERGNQGIEPNSLLHFVVDLCKVAPFVEKEAEE